MLEEAIWVSGASQDYLEADSSIAPSEAIDGLIELIRLFPEMGRQIPGSSRIRRALVGRKRIYGLFYAFHARRLIVLALIDLRQDPEVIESILSSRLPQQRPGRSRGRMWELLKCKINPQLFENVLVAKIVRDG